MPVAAAINLVFAYWCTHSHPDASHRAWLERHGRLLPGLRRGEQQGRPHAGTDYVYVVISGLLARVVYHADGRRRILRLVQPGEAIGTTVNLYTRKRPEGDLIALRHTHLLQLPAAELKAFKEADRAADDLVDAWREREKKRKAAHNALLLLPNDQERCLEFRRLHTALCLQLTQQDIADYLNVSRDTVKRAYRPKKK